MNPAAELEAALERDPYDAATHAVYGDWLHEQGDPRGELAALHAATECDRGRERDLLAFVCAHRELVPECRCRCQWLGGFIQRAEVSAEHVAELVEHPSSRFLAELVVRLDVDLQARPGELAHEPIEPLFALLGGRRRALRTLEIEGHNAKFSLLGDLGPLWGGVPHLERLSLNGCMNPTAPFNVPQLHHLRVGSFRMQPYEIRAIRRAPWPSLTHLEIRPGWCTHDTLDEIGLMLASTPLPRLERLAIVKTHHLERVLVRMQASPLLRQLRELDVHAGELTDYDAGLIASSFRNLERVDVSQNAITEHGLRRLRAVVKEVVT